MKLVLAYAIFCMFFLTRASSLMLGLVCAYLYIMCIIGVVSLICQYQCSLLPGEIPMCLQDTCYVSSGTVSIICSFTAWCMCIHEY